MKRYEILNMPAGKEIDWLIVEKVFDVKDAREKYEAPLPFSTDIAAAWEVIQHFLNTSRKRPKIDRVAEGDWRVQIDDWRDETAAYSSSAPLAICRAALLAETS